MTDKEIAAVYESSAVQLARLQGALNLVARLVEDLAPRVSTHDAALAALTLTSQRLDGEATSREKTVVATAIALKDAKDATDAATRAEAAKSEQGWTPMARLFAASTAIAAVVAVYSNLR